MPTENGSTGVGPFSYAKGVMMWYSYANHYSRIVECILMKKGALIGIIILVLAAGIAGVWAMYRPELSKMAPAPVDTGPKEIVIGYNAAQSKNSVANFGIAAALGTRIAVEEINAAGGILGKPVRLVVMDDEGDKEISKKNMEKLIFEEKAAAIIGPANSGNALYWLDLPQDNEVITISPVATATEITTRFTDRPRNYIFRISSLDKEQVRHLIAWTMTKVDKGNIALLHDVTPYGLQGQIDITEILGRWGKAPVYVRPVEKTATEAQLVAMLEEAQNAGAEAIMIYSLVDISSAVVKAAATIKDFRPIFLGTAANMIDLWNLAGEASSNLYFSGVIVEETDPVAIRLNAAVEAMSGKPSPAITTTANAYDAVYLLKAAFEKAGTTDRKAVRDALENIENIQGSIRFYDKPFSKSDHEAMSAEDYTVGHWVDGARVLFHDEVGNLEIR